MALAAAAAPAGLSAGKTAVVSDDASRLEQLVRDDYDIFYRQRDKKKYRALLTDDYLLLEKGRIYNAAQDTAMMPAPGADYHRTDSFDFRQVKLYGDTGYIVYFLKSQIVEKGATRNLAWLESVIARRSGAGWRVALLHSTRIANESQ